MYLINASYIFMSHSWHDDARNDFFMSPWHDDTRLHRRVRTLRGWPADDFFEKESGLAGSRDCLTAIVRMISGKSIGGRRIPPSPGRYAIDRLKCATSECSPSCTWDEKDGNESKGIINGVWPRAAWPRYRCILGPQRGRTANRRADRM